MNVTIIYFSQTGSTHKVAQVMAEVFQAEGHAARTIALARARAQDLAAADVVGVGTPCFSSQAPTPVKAFLNNLPYLDHRPAFVFATCSGAPGRVLSDLAHLLQGRGANVIGGCLVRGAVHHPAPCLAGRFPDRPDTQDLASARVFAEAVVKHESEGRAGAVAQSDPHTFKPGKGFYDLVARFSTDAFLRRTLPEPQLDSARCDGCQLCIDECPMHNISAQPYPSLGGQCIRCYRCLTVCPQKAFGADWTWSNLAILAFYNITFERWFGDVRTGEPIYGAGSLR